jgi:hypothetical protein
MPTFRAELVLGGKTATGLEVPESILTDLASGKRPAVTVTLNGIHSYRSTIAPMGGSYWIPVAAEHRTAAGLAAGDQVDVTVELDTAPREVEVPADLASELASQPAASATWQSLSYSDKRWHVLQIDGAKTDETRQRRLRKTIDTLNAGRKR